MPLNQKDWHHAKIGMVFEDVPEKKRFRKGVPVVYDVKIDREGNGFKCSDVEHAGIMSSLALIFEHLRNLEDSMSIVCTSVREYHDAAKPDHAVDPVEITKVLENAIMEGVARAMKPVKCGELKKKGKS